jgi:hypothetical protein
MRSSVRTAVVEAAAEWLCSLATEARVGTRGQAGVRGGDRPHRGAGAGYGRERVARARERLVPLVGRLVERAQADGHLRPGVTATETVPLEPAVDEATLDEARRTWRPPGRSTVGRSVECGARLVADTRDDGLGSSAGAGRAHNPGCVPVAVRLPVVVRARAGLPGAVRELKD